MLKVLGYFFLALLGLGTIARLFDGSGPIFKNTTQIEEEVIGKTYTFNRSSGDGRNYRIKFDRQGGAITCTLERASIGQGRYEFVTSGPVSFFVTATAGSDSSTKVAYASARCLPFVDESHTKAVDYPKSDESRIIHPQTSTVRDFYEHYKKQDALLKWVAPFCRTGKMASSASLRHFMQECYPSGTFTFLNIRFLKNQEIAISHSDGEERYEYVGRRL